MMRLYTFLWLTVAACGTPSQRNQPPADDTPVTKDEKTNNRTAPGLFSARAKDFVGFYQLEFISKRQARLKTVVTMHLPPAELENRVFAVAWLENGFCLSPPPKTIDRCGQMVDGAPVIGLGGGRTLRMRPSE